MKRPVRFGRVVGLLGVLALAPLVHPCTIAAISGKYTKDGRPLLWKNRDVAIQDNLARFFAGKKYSFVGIIETGDADSVYAGVNSEGFAIINAASLDLEGTAGSENGIFMKRALEECATVAEFENLLLVTNGLGRKTLANFGVMDAQGGCAILETGNSSFTRFDAVSAPQGFIVRTNFALTGVKPEEGGGFVRFNRAHELLQSAASGNDIDYRFVLRTCARDLVNESVNPYPLPFEGSQNGHPRGYLYTNNSINRYLTASGTVIQGVLLGEDPRLSTMWCILGEPVCGVALPLWARAQSVPYVLGGAATSLLRDAVKYIEGECYTDSTSDRYLDSFKLVNEKGRGILPFVERLEALIFQAAEAVLSDWRKTPPGQDRVRVFQDQLSAWTYHQYISRLRF